MVAVSPKDLRNMISTVDLEIIYPLSFPDKTSTWTQPPSLGRLPAEAKGAITCEDLNKALCGYELTHTDCDS
ncbi:Ff.00g008690.m01.CDS01 [Fusarium sp. VM40]|nr:Ff.00g008690.m01.CDS01 [Fusarium sp. VM40]